MIDNLSNEILILHDLFKKHLVKILCRNDSTFSFTNCYSSNKNDLRILKKQGRKRNWKVLKYHNKPSHTTLSFSAFLASQSAFVHCETIKFFIVKENSLLESTKWNISLAEPAKYKWNT